MVKSVKMRKKSVKTQFLPHELLRLIKNFRLRFLPFIFISSFSAQVLVDPCTDLVNVDFGFHDMAMENSYRKWRL